jgi:hypothetical protein
MCCIELCLSNSTPLNLAYASRVELPNGNYLLVLETEEGGVDVELQFVEVNQDIEEPKASVADEGKHRSINLSVFGIMQLSMYVCAFTFGS